jgi:hypothetical protein
MNLVGQPQPRIMVPSLGPGSGSQLSPLKVRYRSQSNGRATLVWLPYRTGQDLTSMLWLLPLFVFRHVVVRLDVSTESRGSGCSFDRSFRHMSHACSEPRARSSCGHRRLRRTIRSAIQQSLVGKYFTIHIIGNTVLYQLQGWGGRPRRSSVLSLGEAFGGV